MVHRQAGGDTISTPPAFSPTPRVPWPHGHPVPLEETRGAPSNGTALYGRATATPHRRKQRAAAGVFYVDARSVPGAPALPGSQ